MTVAYKPDWLWSAGRLIRDGVLAVDADGRIAAAPSPDATVLELPGRVLLPGLVNAHSHAFQRLLRGRTQFLAGGRTTDDFWGWRELMYRFAQTLGPDELFAVSRQAFLEMALAGITAVGEFHYLHRDVGGKRYANPNELALRVIDAAREVGIRISLLRVGYARAGYRVADNPRQARFIDPDAGSFLESAAALAASVREPEVSVGLAPHSVRAVPREWLETVAREAGALVHMHVSEQLAEVEMCRAEHGLAPVELLAEVGLLSPRFTAVHAIHLSEGEIARLGQAGATVCACPSTERDLGDGVVLADLLAGAGAGLALGSDSQAQIDLLDEARQLEGHLRLWRRRRAVLDPQAGELTGLATRLLDAATRGGARSLAIGSGDLAVGADADFFTVELSHPSLCGAPDDALLPAIVFGAEKGAIREVAVRGKLIVRNGHHAAADAIQGAYGDAVRRLER